MSHVNMGQETVATSTRGSRVQARMPPGAMVTGGLPGSDTGRVLETHSWQPEVEPGAEGPERTV
eukprot:2845851-Alexandrium_andersonii.AAC.1